jgi:hypothetical protein
MNYLNSLTELVNPVSVTGRELAHSPKGLIRRAFDAADLYLGAKQFTEPTVVQSALLARVNRTYVHWAIKRQAERTQIEAGLVPLVPPPARRILREAPDDIPVPAIAIPDVELIDFVRSVGVDRVLNAAVMAEAAQ